MNDNPSLDMEFVRAQFPSLGRDWTFFDNAGGSQILQGAIDRINNFLVERNVQIGGSYEVSQKAAEALYEARTAAMHLVNAKRPEEIVFGNSTTALLQNLARAMESQFTRGDEIIVTVSDHESNIGPWDRLRSRGVNIKFWPLNKDTLTLDLIDLEPLMSDRTRLVCVTHVSNILGTINPVRKIADFVHGRGARLCVDAVAYAPHRLIDVQAFDADYYVFSLYKTFGPHYALMYGKFDNLLELDTLYHYFYGKDKVPGKLEPGNPNYELAYSTCGIVEYLTKLGEQAGDMGSIRSRITTAFKSITEQEDILSERLLSYLRSRNDCQIIGKSQDTDSSRVPTIAFRLDGRNAADICRAMDKHNIAMRFGDFHSRRLAEYLGLTDHGGMLRVSLVHYNTIEEIDRFTLALDQILSGETGFAKAV
ncbi:cysteine desulfurase-like protein [Brucella sp. C7-11G]